MLFYGCCKSIFINRFLWPMSSNFHQCFSIVVVGQLLMTIFMWPLLPTNFCRLVFDDYCQPTFVDRFSMTDICRFSSIVFWWPLLLTFVEQFLGNNCWSTFVDCFFRSCYWPTINNCFRWPLPIDFQWSLLPTSGYRFIMTVVDNLQAPSSIIVSQLLSKPPSTNCFIIIWNYKNTSDYKLL